MPMRLLFLAILGAFSVLLTLTAPASGTELWDLIIIADMENGAIVSGQSPIVAGNIVDHASKPVEFVQVHIRTGQESVFTTTDERGMFRVILSSAERIPGTYIVSIVGTAEDGKTGIGEAQFQVKGELQKTSILEGKLSSAEAKKYLASEKEDFLKDPIGLTLFNHYQKMYSDYLEEKKKADASERKQFFVEQQKNIAKDLRKNAIEEFNPMFGMFSGYRYDDYVKSLDPDVKETIVEQLNYTKKIVQEGQMIRERILSEGGSLEEARQAYLQKIMTTKKQLDNFGIEETELAIEAKNETNYKLDEFVSMQEPQHEEHDILDFNVNGTKAEIQFDGEIVTINVNGTNIRFFINSTGVYQTYNTE